MINLLRLLGLPRDADPESVEQALLTARHEAGARGDIDGVPLERLEGVLGHDFKFTHYRRVQDQYTAMAEAMELLDLPGTADSHRWRERTIEFLVHEDDLY